MISWLSFLGGFINTSIIPGLPIPLVFWLMFTLFIFRLLFGRACINFKKADFFFCIFWLAALLSVLTSSFKSIILFTQLINVSIFYVFYCLILVFFRRSHISYEPVYRGLGFFLFFNFLVHFIGYLDSGIGRQIVVLFNNSSSYSLGGIYMATGDIYTRMGGILPEPSFLSVVCTITICLYFIIEKNKVNFLILLFAVLILLLTKGRTGIASLVVFLMLYPFSFNRKVFLLSFSVFCSAGLVFTVIFLDYLMTVDDSFRQRFSANIYALEGFLDRPLVGNAFGSFQEYSQVRSLDFRDIFFWPLNLLFSAGSIGLVFFCLFVMKNFDFSNNISRKIFIIYFSVSIMLPSYNFFLIWLLLAVERLRCNNVYNS